MENVKHYLTLELSAKQYEKIQVKQYDIDSRELIIKLVNNGTPYLIDTSTSVRIKCEKNDGTRVFEDCTVLGDGTISVIISEQMTACEGMNDCELLFTTTDKALHSMNFGINVRKSVFSDDEITSSNEYIALENALIKVDKVNDIVDEALEDVDEAVASINKLESTIKVGENARVSAENTRKSAENIRIANEKARVAEFEEIKEIVAEVDDVFDTASGTSILLQNSIDDELVDFKMYGGSSQKSYSGYQLFDASKLPTTSAGGATVKNNGDGSFTVSGSGNLTGELSLKYTYNSEENANLLKAGIFTLKTEMTTYPYVVFGIYDVKTQIAVKAITNEKAKMPSMTITDEDVEYIKNGTYVVRIYFYGATGRTIETGTIKPMVYIDGDGTYEPFTGAQPSPNPSYPQPIKSKGDCGYNDGEYLQGRYDGTGAFISSSNYICNKNLIPCNAGDVVKFAYETTLGQIIIGFYDKDRNFISSSYNLSQSEYEVTAPTNAAYFYWNANLSGITPSNAKKIVVTINGTYAVKIKSVNKNLWEFGDQSFTYRIGHYVSYPAGTYTFSAMVTSSDTDSNLSRVFFFDKNGATIKYGDLSRNTRSSFTVELDREVAAIRLYSAYYDGISVNDTATYSNIQLELGNTMTDYVPHEEQTTYIPIAEPLRGIGEVIDTIKAVDGLYNENRKLAKGILNGTESWTKLSDAEYIYYIVKPTDMKAYSNVICTHLIQSSSNITNNSIYVGGTRLRIRIDSITSVDDLVAYLQANPIEYVYELAEETFEPFADQKPFRNIQTYNSTTYITATDDPQMEVKYYKNSIDGTCVHDVIEYTTSVLDNKIDSVNSDMLKKTSKLDNKIDMLKDEFDSQFKTLTGSPVLAQGSANGYVVSFTGAGGSEQKSYSGKNLFGGLEFANALVDSGATATIDTTNKKVSLTASTDTANKITYSDFKENTQYTFFFKGSGNMTDYRHVTNLRIYYTDGTSSDLKFNTDGSQVIFVSNSAKSVDRLESIYNTGIATFEYDYFGIQEGVCTLEDFEPFTNAQPSPNPSYPQQIKSKGDMGWFDGELVNGYYSDWHTVVASSNYISNKNKIACKENDDILLVYEESVGSLGIFFYDENNAFISSIKSTLTNELRGVAPANAVYFTFYVNNTNVTTNAKKIAVTINGTYAVKVKSVGKNVFDIEGWLTSLGFSYTKKGNAITIPTSGNADFYKSSLFDKAYKISEEDIELTISVNSVQGLLSENNPYLRVFNSKGELVTTISAGSKTVIGSRISYSYSTMATSGSGMIIDSAQVEIGSIATDYEPYKEHTEWIPLSEPLRGIGDSADEIKPTDGLYRGHRKFKEIVFDGSNDEGWVLQSINEYGIANFYPSSSTIIKGIVDKSAISNKFIKQTTSIADTTSEGIFNNVHNIYIRISQERANTVDEFTAWLAENPITVLYEIAEETIEELDQTPFYRLKTFEGVTHISASDDMEMVVEVPTSRAGGVASIGWSKGNLAQIETQNLSAKIAELQTAIVNM